MQEQTKLLAGERMIAATLTYEGDRIFVQFPYNAALLTEIKSMEGRKWHGYDERNPRKVWSVARTQRNDFTFKFLQGKNPYAPYKAPLIDMEFAARVHKPSGNLVFPFEHQQTMTKFMVTRRQCIVAGEMGVGKTLSVIIAMEWAKNTLGWPDSDYWYIAPKSVLKTIERELRIWGARVQPRLMTYEALTKEHKSWQPGQRAPKFLILDECSRVKTPKAQRSIAALSIANMMRDDWSENAFVILMSGTPAPRAPDDWWHLAEVARPGYLKEGDIFKFRDRLGVIVQKEGPSGGVYPELVTWRDDPNKCQKCGYLKDHQNHDKNGAIFGGDPEKFHPWEPSINEIEKLYKRMSGLVMVLFKKDCLNLPEKRYEQVFLEPKSSTLRVARTITATSSRAIEALTRLRELSDGFQYIEKKVGKQTCDACHGTKRVKDHVPVDPDAAITDQFGNWIDIKTKEVEIECPNCDEHGQVDKYDRDSNRVPTPKDDQLKLDLDAHIDVGRLVIFAGFTESVDRVVDVCHSQGWATIRIDGRGFHITDPKGIPIYADPLELFQDLREQYPLVAWVGEPSSGGIGHTLTASPTIIYYSNSFVGEARSQSEDRGHRPGMDLNRGLTIRDYIHLPTDMKVLKNLKGKRKLELMSMGELKESLDIQYKDVV